MKNKITFIVIIGLILLGFAVLISKRGADDHRATSIIATNFAGYDFARAVTGGASEVSMLLKPGAESHDFEPTPEDIINIKNADLFIYNGGESDAWVDRILHDNEISAERTLRLMDFVELKVEELVDGMEAEEEHDYEHAHDHDHEHEHESAAAESDSPEYDEHIWTSPVNAIKLISAIKDKLSEIYPDRAADFAANSDAYAAKLTDLDHAIREVIANSDKKTLIFADRFPFRYFVDEYGLDYYAAFPGCSEQTEASSSTVAFLINKVKEDRISTILKIELTGDKLARAIADETGANIREFHAAHNISAEDFDRGVTYADIMTANLEVLKEALR